MIVAIVSSLSFVHSDERKPFPLAILVGDDCLKEKE